MLAAMPARLFCEWFQFYQLEPWGSLVEDMRAGTVAATISNFAGKIIKPGTAPLTAADFFPSRIPVPEEDLIEKVKRIFGAKAEGTDGL